jgi:succinate dehydrogenase/fumarate reductase-like Fe-S protein
MKLQTRAFFFNAKTDYLPYYKNFTVTLDEDAKAKDLLAVIQTQNEMFEFPKQKLIFKINGLVVTANEKMADIVEELGSELQVDPVNSYRSTNGLRFNDKDFMESYALLEPYCSEEDLKYYKTLYALHYASETSNFKRNYIGDAILLLAHKLITEGSEHKAEILDAIANADSGLLDCDYENNLFDAEDYTEEINELKAMLKPNTMPSIFETLLSKVIGKKEKPQSPSAPATQPVESIEGKNVAYYSGADVINSTIQEDIEGAGATFISFERSTKHSGAALLESSKELALTKAGTTLLDALDSGAEVLIVESRTDYEMFTKNLKAIECTMGRDIKLEIILASDFLASNQTAAA